MVREPAQTGPAYWWVNQRYTFPAESTEGIMWAPKRGANGRPQSHWEAMREVQPGDRIIHYVDGVILATGVAATGVFDSRRPPSLGSDRWDEEGWMVRVNYTMLTRPIGTREIGNEHRTGSPFNSAHTVNQGYLFPIDPAVMASLTAAFDQLRWDVPYAARYVPAEARQDVTELLKQLIGMPLSTATGKTNTILDLDSSTVLVTTDRSTSGTRIPIGFVSEALDKVSREGILPITVDEVGDRTAFVGAVLRTLPGAHLAGSPPTITFEPDEPDTEPNVTGEPSSPEGGLRFTGNLSRDIVSKARGEQPRLRRALLGSATSASCAVCDVSYPVRFLWAAHIKKHASCSEEEARDLSHIAMVACLFGCDALYESGLIAVDDEGKVISSPTVADKTPLGERVAALRGRAVSAFTDGSRGYFEWHRKNTYLSGHTS